MDERAPLRVGASIDDHCRVCRMERRHTVVALDPAGKPRVTCDTCSSLHDFRGGGREPSPAVARSRAATPVRWPGSEPEEEMPVTDETNAAGPDWERALRRVMREELGLTPVAPAEKWRGGELVLKPGRPGVQEKSWPIENFFAKIVMLRNRLRVLEQQVNGSELPDDQKLKLQGYVTACYGTLTSFNILFADEADRFKGSGGD
jgi:hypothetical protein